MLVRTQAGERQVRGYEDPNYPLAGYDLEYGSRQDAVGLTPNDLLGLYRGGGISPQAAVSGTIPIYAAVSLLSDIVGSISCHLYKRVDDLRRSRILPGEGDRGTVGRGYPGSLARIIGELANEETTAQEMWSGIIWHGALWGAGYAQIVREFGRPSALWPLMPDKIQRFRVANQADSERVGVPVGAKFYVYTKSDNTAMILRDEDVLCVPWSGADPMNPLSPITVARTSIQADLSRGSYNANYYKNGAFPSSLVTIPKGAPDKFTQRAKVYRDAIQGLYGGPNKAGSTAVVEEGITWVPIEMSMKDQQYIEQHKYTTVEAAQLYRIPPNMLGYMEPGSVSYASVEQQDLAFLGYTVAPIFKRIEGAVNRDLGLVPGVKTLLDESIYPEFQVAELLRTDLKTQAEAFASGIQWGYFTRADVRAMKNMDPVAGLDKPLYPANMVVVGEEPAANPQAQLASALMALASKETEPPRVTVNNNQPKPEVSNGHGDTDEMRAIVEGIRNDVRGAELLSRVAGDLDAIHSHSDQMQFALDAVLDEVRESNATTQLFLEETRADQEMLLSEFNALRDDGSKPTVGEIVRDDDGAITSIRYVDAMGRPAGERDVERDDKGNVIGVKDTPAPAPEKKQVRSPRKVVKVERVSLTPPGTSE